MQHNLFTLWLDGSFFNKGKITFQLIPPIYQFNSQPTQPPLQNSSHTHPLAFMHTATPVQTTIISSLNSTRLFTDIAAYTFNTRVNMLFL